MVAGSLLASFILIPMIALFGDALAVPLAPATNLIRDMGPGDIWNNYVRHIGAGAVATGGLFALVRALPSIVSALAASVKSLTGGADSTSSSRTRSRHAHARARIRLARDRGLRVGRAGLRHEPARRGADPGARFPVLGGLLAHHRRGRELVLPALRHDHRRPDGDLRRVPPGRLGGLGLRQAGTDDRRARVHRHQQCGHVLPGPEDGLPARRDAGEAAGRAAHRRIDVGARGRLDRLPAQPLGDRGEARGRLRGAARARGRRDARGEHDGSTSPTPL